MCRVIIIVPAGGWLAGQAPRFESHGKKVTRLMYSDSVDGRLSNKVLGVHFCPSKFRPKACCSRSSSLFPFPPGQPSWPRKYYFLEAQWSILGIHQRQETREYWNFRQFCWISFLKYNKFNSIEFKFIGFVSGEVPSIGCGKIDWDKSNVTLK